jgi:hypothetical protein
VLHLGPGLLEGGDVEGLDGGFVHPRILPCGSAAPGQRGIVSAMQRPSSSPRPRRLRERVSVLGTAPWRRVSLVDGELTEWSP